MLLNDKPIQSLLSLLVIPLLALISSCQSGNNQNQEKEEGSAQGPQVVDVMATDYAFKVPDTIKSGWTRFRMTNKGEESHHFHLYKMPKGKTYEDFLNDYAHPQDSILQLVYSGKADTSEAEAVVSRLQSSWANRDSLVKSGGVGLVGPGRTGQSTVKLDPGRYAMVCLIDNPKEQIHAALGMKTSLFVSKQEAGGVPPQSDIVLKSSGKKLFTEGKLKAKTQNVEFQVSKLPEVLQNSKIRQYYSVWLVKIDEKDNLDSLLQWNGQNPAPYEALGGFEYIPTNQKAYMKTNLEPGRYAWLWFYWGNKVDPFGETFTVE